MDWNLVFGHVVLLRVIGNNVGRGGNCCRRVVVVEAMLVDFGGENPEEIVDSPRNAIVDNKRLMITDICSSLSWCY